MTFNITIGPINALTYSSPSSSTAYILAGSSDRNIRLYNPASSPTAATGPPIIATYASHAYPVLSLTIAPSNATFASTSTSDRSIFLWDVSTSKVIRRLSSVASASSGSAARINCVTFAGAAGDDVLISGGYDCAVRIWDVRAQNSRKEIMVLSEAKDSVEVVLAGSRGDDARQDAWEIMSGSSDGRVRCYDIRMGRMTEDLIGAAVTSLARTRDGKAVLVGSLDHRLRLMDTQDGTCLRTYQDESRTAGAFRNAEFRLRSCFGGNERWVLSGNENVEHMAGQGEIVVWDTLSGDVVQRVAVGGARGARRTRVGPDGKEKEKDSVVSCIAWKARGMGDQWCCAGTDGVVTVFGSV